jgi:hypothetical protein
VYLGSLAADPAVFDATANANRGVPRGIGGRSSAGRSAPVDAYALTAGSPCHPGVNGLIAIA